MFAEDVGLLPQAEAGGGAFVALLRHCATTRPRCARCCACCGPTWTAAASAPRWRKTVLRFNGKLFKGWGQDDYVLPLTAQQIDGLLDAATANWREVEPAIFGTLLERALDPAERHALGAHYTPRAYVERLVLPTVVEPLRADWADAQAAALLLATEANALEGREREKKLAEARAEIRRFHHALCTVRVLDPACGSGNFLYVTLEHLKRLEGEVLNQLEALGQTQGQLGLRRRDGDAAAVARHRDQRPRRRAGRTGAVDRLPAVAHPHLRQRQRGRAGDPRLREYRTPRRGAGLRRPGADARREPARW